MTIGNRLDKAMKAAGLKSQSDLHRASGVPQPTISRILKGTGTKGPETETVRKLAEACNVSYEWLNEGKGEANRSFKSELDHISVNGSHKPGGKMVSISNASASMGPGFPLLEQEQTIGEMKISKAWVDGHLPKITSIDRLSILTAYGDSMSPTFSDGDLLLVDRGVTTIELDAVYVISRNQELFVKRVRRRFQDGAVIIKSDNPLFGPDDIITNGEREGLNILGRVVWAWSGKRL